jgi:P-type conjugative transfer protein TrbJ
MTMKYAENENDKNDKKGKSRKSLILVSILTMLACSPLACSPLAFAGGTMTGGATMPEQIVQEITATSSLARQAQEVATQIQQYQNMVQNMVQIPQQLMGQITGTMDSFVNIAQQAQQLSYAGQNISSQFSQMHVGQTAQSASNYASSYGQISSNLSQAINNALTSANMNPTNFATTAQAQKSISAALANPQSRNALLQGSVAASQDTVTQLTQMNQTASAEATMEASAAKAKLAKQNAARQYNQNAIADALGGRVTSNTPSLSAYKVSGI